MKRLNNRCLVLRSLFFGSLKTSIVVSLFFIFILGFKNNDFSIKLLAINFAISILYAMSIGFGNNLLNLYLNKKWDWLLQTNLRLFYGVVVTLLYTIPIISTLNYIVLVCWSGLSKSEFFNTQFLFYHLFILFLSLGISAVMHAKGFMENWKRSWQNEALAQKATAEFRMAQFETLKNQIDPHFLFNSF